MKFSTKENALSKNYYWTKNYHKHIDDIILNIRKLNFTHRGIKFPNIMHKLLVEDILKLEMRF